MIQKPMTISQTQFLELLRAGLLGVAETDDEFGFEEFRCGFVPEDAECD